MQIDGAIQLRAVHVHVGHHVVEKFVRELAVVLPRELDRSRSGHLPVLNHAGSIAHRAPKPELHVLHVVIEVVGLVVEAIKVRERSRRPPGRMRRKVDFRTKKLEVFEHTPPEEIREVQGLDARTPHLIYIRVHVGLEISL